MSFCKRGRANKTNSADAKCRAADLRRYLLRRAGEDKRREKMLRQCIFLQTLLLITTFLFITSCAGTPPGPQQILHQICDEHQKLVVGSTGQVYASRPGLCNNHMDYECRRYLSTVTTKPESQMSEQEVRTLRKNIASHCGNAYVACMLIMSGKLSCEEASKEFPW